MQYKYEIRITDTKKDEEIFIIGGIGTSRNTINILKEIKRQINDIIKRAEQKAKE